MLEQLSLLRHEMIIIRPATLLPATPVNIYTISLFSKERNDPKGRNDCNGHQLFVQLQQPISGIILPFS